VGAFALKPWGKTHPNAFEDATLKGLRHPRNLTLKAFANFSVN
jgi:hypothetical protein